MEWVRTNDGFETLQPQNVRLEPLTPEQKAARWRIRHLDARRRTLEPLQPDLYDTPVERAAKALWPWTRDNFPGLVKCSVALFGHRVAAVTVKQWRNGFRPAPPWAIAILIDTLESKATHMLAIATELRAYRGGPGRGGIPAGWAKVRKDGTTPRWRGGRPAKPPQKTPPE